jgi:hypothetical protein
LVAIDAEFVAVARAETSFEGGVEVQLKPSRWGLFDHMFLGYPGMVVGLFAVCSCSPNRQGRGGVLRRACGCLRGFMVAIDAEFVAVARAETSFEGGVEVQLKPSRCGRCGSFVLLITWKGGVVCGLQVFAKPSRWGLRAALFLRLFAGFHGGNAAAFAAVA